MGSFLVAIAVGQSVGIVVAALVLPAPERRLVPFVAPAFRQVLAFGGWRGAQVALTPAGSHRQPARRAQRHGRRGAR